MRKLVVLLAMVPVLLLGALNASATTEHCPDGGTKVEAVGDELNGVVPAAGTLVCVKGSTDATGIVVADGQSTLFDILGNGHDVSYYVVYEGEPSETPTPTEPPPTDPPPTDPPPTEPPPTEPPPTDGGDWTPSWHPSSDVTVGESPRDDLAQTGGDVTVPLVVGGGLVVLGLSALAFARRKSQ